MTCFFGGHAHLTRLFCAFKALHSRKQTHSNDMFPNTCAPRLVRDVRSTQPVNGIYTIPTSTATSKPYSTSLQD
jgi:hypothetical protein